MQIILNQMIKRMPICAKAFQYEDLAPIHSQTHNCQNNHFRILKCLHLYFKSIA